MGQATKEASIGKAQRALAKRRATDTAMKQVQDVLEKNKERNQSATRVSEVVGIDAEEAQAGRGGHKRWRAIGMLKSIWGWPFRANETQRSSPLASSARREADVTKASHSFVQRVRYAISGLWTKLARTKIETELNGTDGDRLDYCHLDIRWGRGR